MDSSSEPKRVDRVVLACVQCRSRHVKCDATQPVCGRCQREGKECTYQKSRRGGLDKAALARRRLRLLQEARDSQPDGSGQSLSSAPSTASSKEDQLLFDIHTTDAAIDAIQIPETLSPSNDSLTFQVNAGRLLDLFFENFWPSFPITLPCHYLQARYQTTAHGMDDLMLVLHWIGSLYAPWTPSEPFYVAALQSLRPGVLLRTPFNVQALTLFAIALYHIDVREGGIKNLNLAITIALELRMNQKGFAQAYGEGNPVLEESLRRTYYMLNVIDQHFAIITNTPTYTLMNVTNMVDLPCDDEFYESGNIPPLATWQEYENREFAEVEIVYSSIVYLYDIAQVVKQILAMFIESGSFGEHIVDHCDTKLAIWSTLLPTCKKDPLRRNGQVDEVMFTAHMIAAISISTMHRPFSSLTYSVEEMSTQAFLSPTPFVVSSRSSRNAHTARTLKAVEMQTKLLAIPCTVEKHNVFTMCVCAQSAAVQVSACVNLLEDHALSIARDRVRLSIGFLNAMGSIWPLGKQMAKEVRGIARSNLTIQNTVTPETESAAEIDVPRDELLSWPVNPAAQIDIYSGIVLWDDTSFSYPSLDSSNLI